MDYTEAVFFAHIVEAYSLRNAFGIITKETDNATMILSPKMIEISFKNNGNYGIHKLSINTAELSIYKYNPRDANGNLLDEYPIGFFTSEMCNATKNIGKRDSAVLYQLIGDNKINIQIIKAGNKDPGKAAALFVNILNIEHQRAIESNSYAVNPNVRIQSKDFADLCSQIGTIKCSYMQIVGGRDYVTFKGILPNNNVASINRFVSQSDFNIGEVTDMPPVRADNLDSFLSNLKITPSTGGSSLKLNISRADELITVSIPLSTVKSLSKIHNISPAGTSLRFYFKPNNPVKIECPIGTYGTYTVYLRSVI